MTRTLHIIFTHFGLFSWRFLFAAAATAAVRPAGSAATTVRSMGSAVTTVANKFDTPDANYDDSRLKPGNGADKRAFTYFMLGGARFLYASAVRLAVINVVATLSASADVLALAAVEVDLSNIAVGQTVTVKWRGKPVFIKRRTEAQIKESEAVNISELRHQQTDAERVKNPEWLVVLGVCTHLGCVPMPNAGDL